ncbi:hypothetical protein HNO88_002494 [Novosphingobium chloroacetimidivorans]|uniref:Uncharacterized protein n=1 Tax=Novosphingobium chloroacetimidivorans TaxID=1428314 RepID=A0A7W7KAF4_9SPHN|nr:hypothetical protein [Novosphingobium chloroacetimidivorans]MBB4859165.1 hypothetical protein [Novosphingobium chloroacetimidivorans]
MPLAPSSVPAANIAEVLQDVVGVIDMSDPEHGSFADSAADCLDELLRHETPIRAALAAVSAPGFINTYGCPCGATFENLWPAQCDDKCPACGTTCSPTTSADQ